MASLTPKINTESGTNTGDIFQYKTLLCKKGWGGGGGGGGLRTWNFQGLLKKEHVEIPKFSIIKTKRTRISRGVLRKTYVEFPWVFVF